jgi:isopentenyldiphosphate isomerase
MRSKKIKFKYRLRLNLPKKPEIPQKHLRYIHEEKPMLIHGVKAKIAYLNLNSHLARRTRRSKPHLTGYQSGYSPETDILSATDHKGAPVGAVGRKQAHTEGVLHACVHLLLFDPTGKQIIVQRRGLNKDSSPGKLSQSVGGHVGAGFSPEETLAKQSREELGICPQLFRLKTVFPYKSNLKKNQEVVFLFSGTYGGPLYPNYSELAWAGYFNYQGIKALAQKEPQRFAPSFLQDLKHLDAAQKTSSLTVEQRRKMFRVVK